jgi:hypothetical protein
MHTHESLFDNSRYLISGRFIIRSSELLRLGNFSNLNQLDLGRHSLPPLLMKHKESKEEETWKYRIFRWISWYPHGVYEVKAVM